MSYSPRSSDSSLLREECPGIVAGIERPEVVHALTHPDELHGEPELDRDRNRDTASGAPVELRERDTGDAGGIPEQPRLLEAVLPRRRIHDEQRLVRGALETPADDPTDLLELGHEVGLRVQSPGGVDDRNVAATR